jgi:hypothetical protein
MEIGTTQHYGASVEAVLAHLTDPEVLAAKYASMGHEHLEVVEHAVAPDGAVRLRTRRQVPVDVPAFARKFLSPKSTVEQLDDWEAPSADGSRRGRWTVTSKGVPVEMGGTMTLRPAGDGCDEEVRGTVRCTVPLVGGKLASFVGGEAQRSMERDLAYHAERLAAS